MLFRSALQEAGQDTSKKALLVNQIAETLSKINKVEDFTRQQDYIKRCAQLLKIDESGLHALVNQFIRDRITQQQKVQRPDTEPTAPESVQDTRKDSLDSTALLKPDLQQERALVRCLIEYGTREWDPGKTVAAYIFEEMADSDLLETPLLQEIVNIYKKWYEEIGRAHV